MSTNQLLDQAYSRARLDELDPAAFAPLLEAELPDELVARDAAFAAALDRIDAFAARAMRLLIEPLDLAPPTRNVFATTILAYARDLELLASRVQRAAPAAVDGVLAAARRVFALRDQMRDDTLALAARLALAAVATADAQARDRRLDEPTRKRWSALRRELEAVGANPTRVATPLADRLKQHADQLDEPAPQPEPTLAELIELD